MKESMQNLKLDISKVQVISAMLNSEKNGKLVVFQENSDQVPFSISRMFLVYADKNCVRGQHAHIECSQLLICTSGSVGVYCDDGKNCYEYLLDKPNIGLLISPKVWAEQIYLKDNTVLNVLCNKPFDESDYIRNYDEFKSLVGVDK